MSSGEDGEDGKVGRRSKSKYTPLEEQYMQIKKDHPDVLLFIECGYKYRFFGEDAEIASRVLRIYCFMKHNFMTASVPTHRLAYHVERMVRAGHKVGVVRQLETAALKKVGTNKSGPFVRKLTEVYTVGTLVSDSLGGVSLFQRGTSSERISNSYIMSLYENDNAGTVNATVDSQESVNVELIAIDVTTGEILYDRFCDNQLRQELDSRLISLEPVEILIPEKGQISKRTDSVLSSFCSNRSVRLQRLNRRNFEKRDVKELEDLIQQTTSIEQCCRALYAAYKYVSEFSLEQAFHESRNYTQFSARNTMTLSGAVLENFEIFANMEDGSAKGTLFAFLNRTLTAFGARELRRWLAHPLIDCGEVQRRHDAVEEVRESLSLKEARSPQIARVLKMLHHVPDLERNLPRLQYQKCNPAEFWATIKAFDSVASCIADLKAHGAPESELIRALIHDVADVNMYIQQHVRARINEEAAVNNDFTQLFVRSVQPVLEEVSGQTEQELELVAAIEEIYRCVELIEQIDDDLQAHLEEIRKVLKRPKLQWKQIHLEECLVELPVEDLKLAGVNWLRINQTKANVRFRTPRTAQLLQLRAENKERLHLDATRAWRLYLGLFSQFLTEFRSVVRFLAVLDVLASFARVSTLPGYCKPTIAANEHSGGIYAEGARHPVAESLPSGQSFVPNDIKLGFDDDSERVMVLTGPNMGGKSTFVRTCALLAIMAQVGCFVPATKLTLAPFDNFFARLGASDCISKGLSTFMVELSETSAILKGASRRSFVAIDELGRGTSTHDGTAIAHATLEYLVEDINCTTVFITHYPMICKLRERFSPTIGVFYMNYLETAEANKAQAEQSTTATITFLYRVTRGVAEKSYGLNVARMAQLPKSVLTGAAEQARRLEANTATPGKSEDISKFLSILQAVSHDNVNISRRELLAEQLNPHCVP
eukprot:Plantae.Rhodophyta-Purpureofilum_apyrenoidigerum.ctg7008.p1 GENE.Plantae.Rhodophyta-Purpureofilum_apyrenoidigerum.ctg7008~~Plantae.Rhodophyta-Purpureofilum_apyrenoidigerum.ctg7008.p1  ORF type:complete len:973 (+),score=165.88 Plantae.Rhodophyta-Purpureofilum_apyrenoidigerum.ctg7008:103-2919(+)